jgi:flagellar motor switch protein FliG
MDNADEAAARAAWVLCRLSLRDQLTFAQASLGAPSDDGAVRGAEHLGASSRGVPGAGEAEFAAVAAAVADAALFKAAYRLMDDAARSRLAEALGRERPELVAALKAGGFEFDELENASAEELKALLARCDRATLVKALKGAGPLLRAKVFTALEPESALSLRRTLETHGPVPLAEVVAAQRAIEDIVRALRA